MAEDFGIGFYPHPATVWSQPRRPACLTALFLPRTKPHSLAPPLRSSSPNNKHPSTTHPQNINSETTKWPATKSPTTLPPMRSLPSWSRASLKLCLTSKRRSPTSRSPYVRSRSTLPRRYVFPLDGKPHGCHFPLPRAAFGPSLPFIAGRMVRVANLPLTVRGRPREEGYRHLRAGPALAGLPQEPATVSHVQSILSC